MMPWRSKFEHVLVLLWRSLFSRSPKSWNCERHGHVWQTTATEEINMELMGLQDDSTMYEHTELIREACVHCDVTRERERIEVREH